MWEIQVLSLGQEDLQRREWLLTPVFLPGEFRGQRSLAGHSPSGHEELDPTEWLAHTMQFSGTNYIHTIVQLSPSSVSQIFHLPELKLWASNTKSPLPHPSPPYPSPWHLHTFWLYKADCSRYLKQVESNRFFLLRLYFESIFKVNLIYVL